MNISIYLGLLWFLSSAFYSFSHIGFVHILLDLYLMILFLVLSKGENNNFYQYFNQYFYVSTLSYRGFIYMSIGDLKLSHSSPMSYTYSFIPFNIHFLFQCFYCFIFKFTIFSPLLSNTPLFPSSTFSSQTL